MFWISRDFSSVDCFIWKSEPKKDPDFTFESWISDTEDPVICMSCEDAKGLFGVEIPEGECWSFEVIPKGK